jgi:hypothetical protein
MSDFITNPLTNRKLKVTGAKAKEICKKHTNNELRLSSEDAKKCVKILEVKATKTTKAPTTKTTATKTNAPTTKTTKAPDAIKQVSKGLPYDIISEIMKKDLKTASEIAKTSKFANEEYKRLISTKHFTKLEDMVEFILSIFKDMKLYGFKIANGEFKKNIENRTLVKAVKDAKDIRQPESFWIQEKDMLTHVSTRRGQVDNGKLSKFEKKSNKNKLFVQNYHRFLINAHFIMCLLEPGLMQLVFKIPFKIDSTLVTVGGLYKVLESAPIVFLANTVIKSMHINKNDF